MEELKYDVVIIGGGPSGATVGNLLSKKNINCCIIDKEIFPRHKLCAGVLTEKTIELLKSMDFHQNINNYYNNKTNKLKMYYKNDLSLNIETNTFFYFTNRFDFDNKLINNYLSNGGKLFAGTKINNIDMDNNQIITSNNKKIEFQYLVGADGANSFLRKYIDKNYKPNGFCVEIDIIRDNILDNYAKMYFGDLVGNYGWVFPKENHLTVGFGGILNKAIDYKQELNEFIKKTIPEDKNYPNILKGHYLPYGKYIKEPIYKNKLLLVGDAAGLVDPISGEGIYFSLLSGKYATESLIERLEGRSDNFNSYLSKLKRIHKIIDDGVWFQKMFYNSRNQRVLFKHIKGHDNIAAFVYDNLVSYYNYSYKGILKIIIDYKQKKRKKNMYDTDKSKAKRK